MITAKLDTAIRAVCPIHGVSIGRAGNKATWRIDFKEEATAEQRAAAQLVLQSFDPSAPSQEDYVAAVQAHLDARAKERGYDGILSAATYATSQHSKFGPEGVAYRNWRDAVWAHCYTTLAGVTAGTRTVPTEAELIAELPVLVLP